MSESVLMEDQFNKIKITSTYIQIGKNTYPISGVTKVSSGRIPPNTSGGNFLVLLSFLGFMISASGMFSTGVIFYAIKDTADLGFLSCPIEGSVVSLIALIISMFLYRVGSKSTKKAEPSFYLTLGTSSGDRKALVSKDESLIKEMERVILTTLK